MLHEVIEKFLTSESAVKVLISVTILLVYGLVPVVYKGWVELIEKRRTERKQTREIAALQAEIGQLWHIVHGSADKDRVERKSSMETGTLLSLFGSIASIISLIQQNKDVLHPKTVLEYFRERQQDSRLPEYELGKIVTESEVFDQASILIAIFQTDDIFLDRIEKRCIEPYRNAIKDTDLDETDVYEQRNVSAKCVCRNISMALEDNGGRFPNDAFRDLWEKFGCK